MEKTVIVVIAGGGADVMEKPDDVTVLIRDYDVTEEDINNCPEHFHKDEDGDWYVEAKF
jgi:hypothetical protein